MKIKIQKKKFLRNIIICVIGLAIALLIVNTAPGYKRDKFANMTNLVVGDENVTEHLKSKIHINEKGTIYVSLEDVKTLFDPNIYYDETYNQVVTTSDTKVAVLELEKSQMIINEAKLNIYDGAIKKDETVYLPLSEMNLVYNISIEYIPETDIVVIDKLNEGMIKADIAEETTIKFRPRTLSKKVGEIAQGKSVSCYYTTSKGWRLIRTENGTLGYVKANILANEYILRQDMNVKEETTTISLNGKKNITLNGEEIEIQKLFKVVKGSLISLEKELDKEVTYGNVWATIDCNTTTLNDYEKRAKLIDNIIYQIVQNDIKGISINFTDDNNTEKFIIELVPRLREMGIKTNIVLNEYVDESRFVNIVDYLIKN